MQCISCKTPLSPAFKHAFSQNICPACGGPILDEESLAIIEDVSKTLSSEATLRSETSDKLAMTLVARYDISLRKDYSETAKPVAAKKEPKIAPPSVAQQVAKQKDANIVSAEAIAQAEAAAEAAGKKITDAEREAIMADVVSKHYGMVDGVTAASLKGEQEDQEEFDQSLLQGSSFSDSEESPILEQERILRLQKQQQALRGGGKSAFRRSG